MARGRALNSEVLFARDTRRMMRKEALESRVRSNRSSLFGVNFQSSSSYFQQVNWNNAYNLFGAGGQTPIILEGLSSTYINFSTYIATPELRSFQTGDLLINSQTGIVYVRTMANDFSYLAVEGGGSTKRGIIELVDGNDRSVNPKIQMYQQGLISRIVLPAGSYMQVEGPVTPYIATGNFISTTDQTGIRKDSDTGFLSIGGGASWAVTDGAVITLYGESHATRPGQIRFQMGATRLGHFVDSSGNPQITVDVDNKRIYFNNAAANRLGWTASYMEIPNKLVTGTGFGGPYLVSTSVTTVQGAVQAFDANGVSIGWIPIYKTRA